MQTLFFTHQSYLDANQAYHFARVRLDGAAPQAQHGQDYFEVFWLTEGRARHWINGQVEVLRAGDIAFVRPGDIHAFQGPCALTNVLVLPQTVNHLGARYEEMRGRGFWSSDALPFSQSLDAAQMARLTRASEALSLSSRSLLAVESFLLHLMSRVLTIGPVDLPGNAPAWLATALRAATNPEVFQNGAAGLVAASGRTHPHVARAMRKYLGTTPSAYMNRLRMDYAARLLAETDLPLTQVAYDCGIENLSHFHKLFRAQHGAPPARWRRERQVSVVQPVLP